MVEGTGISLYVLVGIIIFGLFVSISVLFGEGILASSGDIIACVESYMSDEPTDCGSRGEDEEIPEYVLATDKDFVGTADGRFRYTGDAEYVKLPHTIKGVPVTSYDSMFMGSSVKKVISDNPNVTDMTQMFYNSQATELDISGIDTSNVKSMWRMFESSKSTEIKGLENFNTRNVTNMDSMFRFTEATDLDLSRFDTSNVTSMKGMFESSKSTEIKGLENFNTRNVTNMRDMFRYSIATELDLSSFDTSNVTNMYTMFAQSSAKTVHARTQVDADKFNASYGKPNRLQAVVKQ